MTQGTKTNKGSRADERRARQAVELRANLKKRKAQARGRTEPERQASNHQGRDEPSQS